MKLLRFMLTITLLATWAAVALPDDTDAEVQELIKQATAKNNEAWKKQIEAKLAANPRLKALSDRFKYHFIHSKQAFKNDTLNWCAFSFPYDTGDESKHQGDVQLIYGGSNAFTLDVNPRTTCSNLIADLGAIDFTKDVNPRQVDIAGERGWSNSAKAVEGNVYLIRVRDDVGNRFFVLMQLLHVDKNGDYIAFTSRQLDGRKLGLGDDKVVRR